MNLPTCNTCGPSDTATQKASCWWATQVLGLGLQLGGRPVVGFGGFGLGAQTYDPTLLAAATAITNLNDPCDLSASASTVSAFQTAWNNTSDGNMRASTNSQNVTNWPLTVDGKYGPNTADAVQAALDTQSPSPCTTYTNSGGGGGGGGGGTTGYSGAVLNAAQNLDNYLAQYGCTACQQAGQPPQALDTLSPLVAAFKNAILVTPGSTSAASATVTGSTINMSSAACQNAYGPGTLADLKAVLGASMTSGSTACTDSSCNCLTGNGQGPTPPAPPPAPNPTPTPCSVPGNPCPPGQVCVSGQCIAGTTPPSSAPTGGSSAGPLLAGVILVGGGAAAVSYAVKRRKGHHHPGL